MSRRKLVASRALWRGREIKAYREWRRLVRKGASTAPGSKRADAHQEWEEAHKQRVRRDRQLATNPVVHVDTDGLIFITAHEGFRTHPYDDSRGFATTGVGHLIAQRSVRTLTWREIQRWTLAPAEVRTLLAHDLARFEAAVAATWKASGRRPTQHQFNACVSLAFNIGVGAWQTSSVARFIRVGLPKTAANAFLMWVHPPELTGRRKDEIRLFNKA